MSITCSPLLSLPAELRDEIYALSLTPYVGEEVDLIETRGLLSAALLQTCRSIYYEAKLFLLEAYPRFWSEANFVVYGCTCTDQPLGPLLASLPNAVFGKIEQLRLELRNKDDDKPALKFKVLPGRNGWIQEVMSDNRTGLRLKLPKRENGRVYLWWRRVDTLEEAAKDCREFEQRNGRIPIKEQIEAIWFQYQRSS